MLNWNEINKYRENNRIEAKQALGGLPQSVWESYSAFANTLGGYILLGVKELPDKSFQTISLPDPEKLVIDFWNTINNTQKVNCNILLDKNVQIQEVDGNRIIVIEVPRASRNDKPIYINNDIFKSFRRNNEGDYRCSKESVQAMLRDASKETQDMLVLENTPFAVFNYDSVKGYRNAMKNTRPGHVWERLEDNEFLLKLGAVARGEDEQLHPTAAGILMFGHEHEIVRVFPHYFLDYQEHFDTSMRWTDRITSSSGEWSGNLLDFFYKAYNKTVQNPNVKTPFKLEGAIRIDDTPVHKALREALANCLINADYHGEGGVVIKSYTDKITLENPGGLRLEIGEALSGGLSVPRNEVLMKIFNLIDIGERAGSGIPSIYQVWTDQKWTAPELSEQLEIERTLLVLSFTKDQKKSSDKKVAIKSSDKKVAIKSNEQRKIIIEYVKQKEVIRSSELLDVLNVGDQRIRKLLLELVNENILIAEGANRNRTYRLKS